MTADEYWRLYEIQGRRCAICKRATGERKRLAIDHDHKCCPGYPTCGNCNRGLLCGVCNKTLGHFRDNADLLRGAAEYLENPPAGKLRIGVPS